MAPGAVGLPCTQISSIQTIVQHALGRRLPHKQARWSPNHGMQRFRCQSFSSPDRVGGEGVPRDVAASPPPLLPHPASGPRNSRIAVTQQRLHELQQFVAEHGHALVPCNHPGGAWRVLPPNGCARRNKRQAPNNPHNLDNLTIRRGNYLSLFPSTLAAHPAAHLMFCVVYRSGQVGG